MHDALGLQGIPSPLQLVGSPTPFPPGTGTTSASSPFPEHSSAASGRTELGATVPAVPLCCCVALSKLLTCWIRVRSTCSLIPFFLQFIATSPMWETVPALRLMVLGKVHGLQGWGGHQTFWDPTSWPVPQGTSETRGPEHSVARPSSAHCILRLAKPFVHASSSGSYTHPARLSKRQGGLGTIHPPSIRP